MKSAEFGPEGQMDRGAEYSAPTSLDTGNGTSRPIEPSAASRPGPPANGESRSRFSPQQTLNADNTTRKTGIATADSGEKTEKTRESEETTPPTSTSAPTAPTAVSVFTFGDFWKSAKISERATRKEIKETERRIGREVSKEESRQIRAEKNALADGIVLAKKQQRLRTQIERRGGPDVYTWGDIFSAPARKNIKSAEREMGRKLTEQEERVEIRKALAHVKDQRIQKEKKILAAR